MSSSPHRNDARVAVLVDCENSQPDILDYALKMAAQFGRVVLRRGYGNHTALIGKNWQDALIHQAFTPCLQYQYVSGKNTADIALALDALEAMFDHRADRFCLVSSDSDFAYLCRKRLRYGRTNSAAINREAQTLCRTAPMMGTAAGLHADHRARRQRTEPGQKARPIELPPRHDPPGAIRHTGHEDILCQIHSNRRSIHFGFPPRRFRLTFSNSILAL